MTNQEAMTILKAAINYSVKEDAAKQMNNAIGCFAEMNGWNKEDAPVKMVELCLAGAEKYKTTHTYILKESNDSSNIAMYLDNQASNDISTQRASK